MRSSLFLLVPLFFHCPPASAAAVASNVCAPANVADCSALKKAGANVAGQLGFPAAPDGAVVFNFAGPMTRAQSGDFIHPLDKHDESYMDSMAVLTPAKKKRTLDTFERVRREAIAMIRGDVRDDQLTAAQKHERDALIKRLETVQPRFIEADSRTCHETSMGMPNAGYMRPSHSIDICPATASVSVQALISTFTHELGHVVEPCNAPAPLYRVQPNEDMRGALQECNRGFVPSEDDGSRDPSITPLVYDAIQRLQANKIEDRLSYMSGDEDTISELASCGIIKPVPEAQLTKPMLFSEIESCIERQSATAYNQQLESVIQSNESAGQPHAQAQAMASRDLPAQCFGRTQEYFADAFSARLMNRIAETDRYSEPSTRAMLLTAAAWGCLAASGTDQDSFAYPPSGVRFQVLTNAPYTSAHLSCEQPRAGAVCEFKSATISATSGAVISRSMNARPVNSRSLAVPRATVRGKANH